MAVQAHRFSVDEYHRLLEASGFDADARVELIDGVVADMSPRTRAHENAIEWLARWLFAVVDQDRFRVRVQSALTLAGSEPEPDLAVIARDAPQPYHPGTATLVIEVAVSSQDRDLKEKPRLYAQAEIEEYWVVDLDRARVVVHRSPGAGAYEVVEELDSDRGLAGRALELPVLELPALFAAAAG